MLVSMTGFGQGEASNRYARVAVEVRSVNHRYLDVAIKMPKDLLHREHDVKDMLKGKVNRGRVSITISTDSTQPKYNVKINVPLMEQYVDQLRRFGKKHGIGSELSINTLATLPEVFVLQENENDANALWPLVTRSMKQALKGCLTMRKDEGKILEVDIRERVKAINQLIKKVEKRAPKVVAHHNASLKSRLGKILDGPTMDKDRMMTEIAIMSDRLDFTEEVIRLKSHMVQIQKCLDQGGAVAKKLTYLLQEVHREGTTIAAKASDAEVIQYMVPLKEESEKLREQVQNLE